METSSAHRRASSRSVGSRPLNLGRSGPGRLRGDDGEGLTSLSADEIFEKTKAAVAAAKSVHATGDTIDSGTTVKLDLQVSETGSTGTLTAEGTTIEMLFAGGAFFIQADKESWTALTGNAAAGEVLEGRYVKVPTTAHELADLRGFVDWDMFVKEAITKDGLTTKGKTKSINGDEAIGAHRHPERLDAVD
jgi:hypothetical protein